MLAEYNNHKKQVGYGNLYGADKDISSGREGKKQLWTLTDEMLERTILKSLKTDGKILRKDVQSTIYK